MTVDADRLRTLGLDDPLPAAVRLRLEADASTAVHGSRARDAGASAVQFETLELVERLRLLPGRRLVARVVWRGRMGCLKLFFGARARRRRDRELAGLELFEAAGLQPPAVLTELAGRSACGLLLEWLAPPEPARDRGWEADAESWGAGLARLHRAGGWHRDLHAGNFRFTAGGLRALDGSAAVRLPGRLPAALTRALRRRNLITLLEACALDDAQGCAAVRGYADGLAADAEFFDALPAAVARSRRRRLRRLLRKARRSSSGWRRRRVDHGTLWYRRDRWSDELAAALDDPEGWLQRGERLKAGNSATLVRVPAGRVVKRYQVATLRSRLKRLAGARARPRRAWAFGQLLVEEGIPCAAPLALRLGRRGWVPGPAYLVLDDLGDRRLDRLPEASLDGELTRAVQLLLRLYRLGIVQSDTKASNFLVTGPAGEVALVDYDGLRLPTLRQLHQDWQHSLRRLQANWPDRPDLAMLIERVATRGLAHGGRRWLEPDRLD